MEFVPDESVNEREDGFKTVQPPVGETQIGPVEQHGVHEGVEVDCSTAPFEVANSVIRARGSVHRD